jgi:protease-4
MDRKAVLAAADGRIYTATQAQSLGLIDQIGDLDSAIREAAALISETSPYVIEYKNQSPFNLQWLWSLSSPFDTSKIKQDLQSSTVPTAMYLYR